MYGKLQKINRAKEKKKKVSMCRYSMQKIRGESRKDRNTEESVVHFASNGAVYLVSDQGEVRKPNLRFCVLS